ncbi:hypothetical protein AX15_002684 [Amanita polypyramis BW_CC]|nr:hypothetical protein AX15_002684 [Amanita polypyramis BW_CC]
MAAAAVIQRPLRGSRVSTFYPVKTLPPLSCLDSAFQLQEYVSLLIRHNVHDVDRIVALPGRPSGKDKERDSEESIESGKNEDKAKGDVTVDEACWIYEQLRRLAQDLTHPLITMLQQECSRLTCPEMKAGEWLYLCVAHGTDGAMEQCCAIDYILHTLDSATALLNSPRAFPSRLQIPPASHRHFSSLARRLGRIFAHAYFHHRDIFAQAEAESSLYARFLALTTQYDLVPPDFIVIPPTRVVTTDGEGEENDIPRNASDKQGEPKPSVILPDPSEVQPPRLLAAALDPQAEREKDKVGINAQHTQPTPGPSTTSTSSFNPTSIRVLGNRSDSSASIKARSPPGLFVSGNRLIPLSAAATAAATTAASLFASAEGPISTTVASTSTPSPSTSTGTPAPGQESPRKAGRPRTDTMVYSEGYQSGNGVNNGNRNSRGTSPIPTVRLGARLNEPEERPAPGPTGEEVEKERAASEEPKTTDGEEEKKAQLVSVAGEAEPLGDKEKQEQVEVERKAEGGFEPIDDEIEVISAPPENHAVDIQPREEAEVLLTMSGTEVEPMEREQSEEDTRVDQTEKGSEEDEVVVEPRHQDELVLVEEAETKEGEGEGEGPTPAPALVPAAALTPAPTPAPVPVPAGVPAPTPVLLAEPNDDSQLSDEIEQGPSDDPVEPSVTELDAEASVETEQSSVSAISGEGETGDSEESGEAKSEAEYESAVAGS